MAPLPPPPTQPPPGCKFSPPTVPITPNIIEQAKLNQKSVIEPRKLKDEIVKVQEDQPPTENYYRSCFQ